MRNTLVIILLCLFAKSAYTQDLSFYLYITDKSKIIDYDSGVPIFDNTDINDVFDNYTVSHFSKAFPLSDYEYLQNVYLVKANSISLAEDLFLVDSVLFPAFSIVKTPELCSYYPDDWYTNQTYTNDTSHLDIIKAAQAWAIEKGNPNIIIGVTDSYFETTHEDMTGKYANIRTNISSTNHGTLVASLIAGKTDNDTGTSSIGFNCRLNASSITGTQELLDMIKDTSVVKTRVLNASWLIDTMHNHPFVWPNDYFKLEQGVYNEIYERGVVTVAAAGNARAHVEGNNRNFVYPASFDHVISVSGIGHEGDTTFNSFNARYVHEHNAGDSTESHQHNSRVDICAPSVRVTGHDFTSNGKYGYRYGWGTSFAAPLVSGTVGLMLSKMSWLTPYQVEYVLKKSSFDHYSISYNKKYAGLTRWTGRIGAGTLNAWGALDSLNVDSFVADYPTTLTFRVRGVTLNTRCDPGRYVGVPNPRINVILENGTPPYRYKWEALPSNNAWIFPLTNTTGVNSITSTITSRINPIMGDRVHYRLTVYDNSEIEKVASFVLNFRLKTDSTADLAMQDSWADLYDEPNAMLSRSPNNWDIWTSPDLWNRHAADLDTNHQNPDTTVTNYMHVRIKNVGCAPSQYDPDYINVHLYWTLAATGEIWDRDWIGNGSIVGIPSPPAPPPGGRITPSNGIAIPALGIGEDTILTHDWTPPDPSDFDTTGTLTQIDVCALARIQTNQFAPNFGITFTEIDTTKVNVLNNNNIVTRNFVSIDLKTGPTPPPPTTGVVIINPRTGGSTTTTIQIITENQLLPYIAGHLATYMSMKVYLGDLFDVWDAGGKLGNPTSFDETSKTVTWNMEEPLRLENIELEDEDKYFIMLQFNIKSGVSLPYEVKDKMVHLRLVSPQTVEVDNGDGTTFNVTRDYVHSAINYSVSIVEDGGVEKPEKPNDINSIIEENWFDVYPNPVSGKLTLLVYESENITYKVVVSDIAGKVVYSDQKAVFTNNKYSIDTKLLGTGSYFVTIKDRMGRDHTKKFVKVE